MSAISGSRTGRIRVLIVDDESGLTELLSMAAAPPGRQPCPAAERKHRSRQRTGPYGVHGGTADARRGDRASALSQAGHRCQKTQCLSVVLGISTRADVGVLRIERGDLAAGGLCLGGGGRQVFRRPPSFRNVTSHVEKILQGLVSPAGQLSALFDQDGAVVRFMG
ncbi:hypothetical protein [Streptomyces sp. KR55]|uniref:hypothetical protein n=1 Tax=Streptomyces sp. KR55 TaxID=3457425 RepID=UPI003FCF0B5D